MKEKISEVIARELSEWGRLLLPLTLSVLSIAVSIATIVMKVSG
jgi:hypothetical protein